MRTRAIADLASSADAELFESVSEGLRLVAENARSFGSAVPTLAEAGNLRGANLMLEIAKEEGAKYLILLDAIRCPRSPQHLLPNQLRRFNDHLAKGIYADTAWWRPVTFSDVREYVDQERVEYYLEGPHDVDWIFRNEILQRREERMYVDFRSFPLYSLDLSIKKVDKEELREEQRNRPYSENGGW
jgi:hypothetical protein